jgi:hypothetical protein
LAGARIIVDAAEVPYDHLSGVPPWNMLQGFIEPAANMALDFHTPRLDTPELDDHVMHSSTTQPLAHTVVLGGTVEQTNVCLNAWCIEKL